MVLLRISCVFLIFISICGFVTADDRLISIEVLSGGKSFDSFEAYAAFKAQPLAPGVLEQRSPVPVFTQDILGVSSPLVQVLQDFQRSAPEDRIMCPPSGLADALQKASDGKQGPLLLVADENRVRIMELIPDKSSGTPPRTNP